jgi:phage tail-like protein
MPTEHGVNLQFEVTIDNHLTLGNWTKCEGLSFEYEVLEYMEGGQNDYVHRLPGRCKYTNIKLTRPIDSQSDNVAEWVAGQAAQVSRHTAKIAVRDANGAEVRVWSLHDAYPVKWTGPSLDVAGNQVATEVLELAHNGFLRP